MAELFCVGSIQDAAAPVAAGAKVYQSSTDFGSPVGASPYLFCQTQDFAPSGASGRQAFRRIYVRIGYDAACVVQVAATADFLTVLPATRRTLVTPSAYQIVALEYKLAKVATFCSVQIQVVSASGRVELLGCQLGYDPMGAGAASIGTTEP